MSPSSLTLPSPAAPRAPSTALLGVCWAALASLAALGVHTAAKGHDLTPPLPRAALPAGDRFDAAVERTNLDGVTVAFGVAHGEDAIVHRGAVKVGERYLALPSEFEDGSFTDLLVSPDGRRWLAVEAFDTEAMGDLQLLASDDGGRTFVHRGTLPWPSYQATLESVRFDGTHVDVELSVDDEVQLAREWWSWLDRVRGRLEGDAYWAMLPAGRYRVHSSNGGRSFGALKRL